MTNPFKRAIPPRAAAVIVALVLVASVVTGREKPEPATIAEPSDKSIADAKEDLGFDSASLIRKRQEGEIVDLFDSPHAAPTLAVALQSSSEKTTRPAPPPPPPSAPALPFKYLGRMADGGKVMVFLENNKATLSAVEGETISDAYRIERIEDSAVHFVYLPLGTKQVLNVPSL